MSALQLCKAFKAIANANFSAELARQYCGQYLGFAQFVLERDVCELSNGFKKFYSFSFYLTNLILNISK
jgi:hypothetical protein